MWHGEDAPQPARVFWPETDDQVAQLLKAASEQHRVLVPFGAGSGVCGGARGRRGSWVLDTKRLDEVGAVDREHWTVEAGAGVIGQVLEDALAAEGFTLGHSPSSLWCSTVGGWAAARSAGQFSSRYGVFEDMVLGLDAVAPGIGPFHVGLPGSRSPSRRLNGALPALLGSEGTLAVVTRVRMRVRPLPERRSLRGYRFADVPSALRAMRELMQAELWPAVVRLYDPVDTLVGGKTRPKRARTEAWWKDWLSSVDRLPEVRRRTLALPLSMPGVLRGLADALATGCLLIVGWEGDPRVVDIQEHAGRRLLERDGEDLGEEPGKRWFSSRHAVSYKLMPVFERGGFADTMEIAAPWSKLPGVYARVRDAIEPTAVCMAHMSHMYPEGGSIYFSMAGLGDREVYDRTWSAALHAVRQAGATVTHHHGVGVLKAMEVSREVGPAVAGWRALKQTLDPANILNPGRVYVDGADWPDPPASDIQPGDGLVAFDLGAPLEARLRAATDAGGELAWPWTNAAGPPRWQRSPWQTTWVEVRGTLADTPCALGRGPRSASGPDVRPWLAEHGEDVVVTAGLVPSGERWMGRARVEHPWAVVRDLLRADLRPGMVGVHEGWLHVGFRGPAAAALGALASEHVPGGLEDCSWRVLPLDARPAVPCPADDERATGATSEHVFRVEKP